jgi:flagellar hook-basal body complex protein FliE
LKMQLDKRFLSEMRARLEGHTMRVGILRNKTHVEAAPKAAGRQRVLGGPARKTVRQARAALRSNLAKKRLEARKLREQARTVRAKGRGKKSKGARRSANKAARTLNNKARAISRKMREMRQAAKQGPKGKAKRVTLREVLRNVQRATGKNILRAPFNIKNQRTRAFKKFLQAYYIAATKKRSMAKVEKMLLDLVRKPVLEKKYGRNSAATREMKGFDRRFVDTGQVLLGLSSEVKKRGRSRV